MSPSGWGEPNLLDFERFSSLLFRGGSCSDECYTREGLTYADPSLIALTQPSPTDAGQITGVLAISLHLRPHSSLNLDPTFLCSQPGALWPVQF